MSDRGVALFEEACAHDREGREAEAVPCYEEALRLGLGDPERARALLGLGSTYRNLGRHDDAVRVLEAAVAEYPGRAELRLFLWTVRAWQWHGAHRFAITTAAVARQSLQKLMISIC